MDGSIDQLKHDCSDWQFSSRFVKHKCAMLLFARALSPFYARSA